MKKNDMADFANSVIKKIWIYGSIYVFEGEKSIFDIISELPCLSDLENPGQLPVQEVLEGTDDCVWWIFEIFSPYMFSRVENPFLIFPLSYYVSVTSKIQVNFRYRGYLKVLMIVSDEFFRNFFTIYVFEGGESISDIPIELPCSGNLENPGQLPVQEVLEDTADCVL